MVCLNNCKFDFKLDFDGTVTGNARLEKPVNWFIITKAVIDQQKSFLVM